LERGYSDAYVSDYRLEVSKADRNRFNDLQTLLSDAGTVVRELVIDPGVVAIGVGRSVGSAAAFAVRRLSRG
jgi:hypothetical protein